MTKTIYFKGTWKEIHEEVLRLSKPINVDDNGREYGLQDELFIINPDTGDKGCIGVDGLGYDQWKEMLPEILKNWINY